MDSVGRAKLSLVRLLPLALAAWLIALLAHRTEPAAYDFIALYASARLVATGRGGEITDPASLLAMEHATLPQREAFLNNPNLPALSGLLAPLGLLPYDAAYVLMLTLSTIALVAAALLLAPLAAPDQRRRLLLPALVGPAALIALVHGQTTPMVLLLLAASLRTRGVASGLLLAGVALRLQVLPLLALAALADRDRPRVLGFGVGCVGIALASLLVTGIDGLARYPALLASSAAETGVGEVSLPGVLRRVAGFDAAAGLVSGALVLAIGAALALRVRAGPARVAAAAPWAALAAPHALLHDLVLAYPAVAVSARTTRESWLWVGAGVAAVMAQLAGLSGAVALWLLALAVRTPSAARRSGEDGR